MSRDDRNHGESNLGYTPMSSEDEGGRNESVQLFENPEAAFGFAGIGPSGGYGAVVRDPVARSPTPGDDKWAGHYPAGFSESGARQLPIPGVPDSQLPPVEVSTRRKRRKKKKIAPIDTGVSDVDGLQEPATGDVEFREGEFVQKAFVAPTYTEPLRRALPPINAKAATFAVTSSAILGPTLPHLGTTSRPTQLVDDKGEMSHDKNGTPNPAFDGVTGFVSQSPNSLKQANIQLKGGVPGQTSDFDRIPKATLYFKDGVRYIDYVIAYEEEEDDTKCAEKRERFERGLEKKGLQLEREPKEESQDQKTCFVKVHVPWDVALRAAERMKMKMPLKEDRITEPVDKEDELDCTSCTDLLKKVIKPCILDSEEVNERVDDDCYTAEFSKEKMDFFDIKDKEHFFSTSERSRIAYRLMSETRYSPKPIHVGVVQLIADGAYQAAFPLHEGKHTSNETKLKSNENMRRLLYWEWARWGRWYKFQPLDLIRMYLGDKVGLYFAFVGYYTTMLWIPSLGGLAALAYGLATLFLWENIRQYLGDKVALYFAWLGYYTEMLIYPTVVGFIVTIYSLATLFTYPPTQEVCDENYPSYAGNITMCPVCDADCGYWKLGSTCLSARVTHVFDNEATIFFAVFMSLWATMFLEFWKRKQFHLAYDWDLVDYDEDRDLVRPEYEAQVTRERLNPVTGRREPYLAAKDRYTRTCLSFTTVIFWVLIVVAAVFAIIVYRLVIAAVFAANVDLSGLGTISQVATPSMLTTITASLLSLIIIMSLNFVYEKMALILTNMELPRTQIEFEDSFTFKMFCFQFVNYYSYLFYVAFFKQSFAGYPADYTYLFGQYRWDECDAGGCMYELSLQLIIIMLGKQIWNNFMEIMAPWILNKYRIYKSAQISHEMTDNEYTRWEQDYDLTAFRQMGLFYEYLEMVIQFGFVTLFVAAFPLAPVLALINNIIEIRLDANKFICELRRPLSQKSSDIGAWYYLLDFLGTLAVVTNAFTIAITSDAIPKMVYFYIYSVNIYGQSTLVGYTNNSLSYFDVNDFSNISKPTLNPEGYTECRYRDYRAPPSDPNKYTLTLQYWHVIASRLAFVIVMEHVVFISKRLIDYLIPDRPLRLRQQIKREHFLVQKMLLIDDPEERASLLTPQPSSASPSKRGNFFVEDERSGSVKTNTTPL